MKRIFTIVFLSIATFLLAQNKYQNQYYFYENKGQIIDQKAKPNPEVKYLFNSAGLNVQIKKTGFSYDVYEVEKKVSKKKQATSENTINPKLQKKQNQEVEYTSKYHRVDINLVNANTNVQIEANGKSPDYENYYNLEHNPKGVEKVHRYERIVYKNVYNNVDLVFFKPKDSTKTVEYNFLVHPGGKVSDIKMKFEGAKTKLKDGKLAMALRFGEMQENIPNSWIEHSNSKQNIVVNFKDLGNQTFGFDSEVNISDKTIVIDPVPTRIWGSFFGGDNDDSASFMTKDLFDNVIFTGLTYSRSNLATTGSYINNHWSTNPHIFEVDGYLTKFDKDGQRLFSTYLRSTTNRVAIDKNNYIIVTGSTTYENHGTPGTYKSALPASDGFDGFIIKLNPGGTRIWGTYYGGEDAEILSALSIDQNNDIVIGGSTNSKTRISTNGTNAGNASNQVYDGFIAKFSTSGQLIWGSYFGGSLQNKITDLTTDEKNNIYAVGTTFSNDGISFGNSYQTTKGKDFDAFLASFSSNGNIIFGTYLGGDGEDVAYNISYGNDKVLLSGITYSKTGIATSDGEYPQYQNQAPNGYNSFYTLFSTNGSIIRSSYFPSTITNVKSLSNGDFYLVGIARNDEVRFSTTNAYQRIVLGYSDAFISKYNGLNFSKIWATYFGGSSTDSGSDIAISEASKTIFLCGSTSSSDRIGTPGTYMPTNTASAGKAFISKFSDCINNPFVSSNSPICVGSGIELKASGGTNFSWTGPNGFTSSLQNPIITNATTANSGIYYCHITGTGGCDGTYTVTVFVGDNEKPIPDNPSLPKLTGDCNFVVTPIPTATDKCAGKITATTTDPLSYSLPGLYTITWTYNDGNGNTETQTQLVEITDQPRPTGNSPQKLCAIKHPKISDIQVVGTNLKWYDASGAILPVNTALVDNKKYYVTQNSAGCESSKLEILVKISDPVAPSGNSFQNFCIGQHPTLADIALTGQNIKWYNASNILLAQTTSLIDGETYYATQTISSCESINKLAVKVAVNNSSIPAKNYVEPTFCNDTTDDFKFINLNDYRTKLITNITSLQFTFYDSNHQLVPDFTKAKLNIGHNLFNVEIKNTVGCSQWFTLEFNLNKKPKLSLPPEVEFCSGIDAELNAGDCAGCTFSWNTGETTQIIKTQTEGTYSVTVTTEKTCQNSASVVVKKAKLATIKNIQIENNLVTIIMSEAGNYLYSDDNINWQTSNQFKLENGNYTIYVKTKAGCIIDQRTISIFEIPNNFSPNADGINDTWKIKGLENYKDSQVIVLDRFGKKLFETKVNGIFEWNGKINGHPLPTDTYWYIINVSDDRSFKGFLVLINRN